MKYTEDMDDFLHQFNPWWKKKSFRFSVNERSYYLDHLISNENKLVKILIGARRVGKTSILYSLINRLLRKGINSQNIIFISGDLIELQKLGVRSIIEHIAKSNNLNLREDKIYLIIDEVQEIKDWHRDIKLYYDNLNMSIFLSGSSASVLAKDTSKLTGRYQLFRVLPLSFKEYIEFRKTKKITNKLLEEYLIDGGYPEKGQHHLPGYLQDIIESTLYRDLLGEYGIRTPEILLDLLKFLADKITTPVSQNRIARDLGIDKNTAGNYLNYLQAVYIIFPLYRNAGSNRISKNYPPKYYFNDTGILKTLSIRTRFGHLAENAVFLELIRRQYQRERYELFYEVVDKQEYDFGHKDDLYEVKMDPTFDALFDYELKGRMQKIFNQPKVITNEKNIRKIQDQGYDLDGVDIKEFLLGNV